MSFTGRGFEPRDEKVLDEVWRAAREGVHRRDPAHAHGEITHLGTNFSNFSLDLVYFKYSSPLGNGQRDGVPILSGC